MAAQLDRAGQPQTGAVQALNFGPACVDLPPDTPLPLDVAGRLVTRRIACDGQIFDLRIVVFGVHSTAAPVLGAERVLTVIPNITHDENFETESVRLPVKGGAGRPWRLIRSTRPGPMVAVAIWVDGKPAGGGLRMRARLAWESLMGAPVGPVLVTVRPEQKQYWLPPEVARATEAKLASMLSQADLDAQIARAPRG